jgi:hypothetical protein
MTHRDRGQKKMIYRTVTEEDGSKNTTTFTPVDLHDDQNGADNMQNTWFSIEYCIHPGMTWDA